MSVECFVVNEPPTWRGAGGAGAGKPGGGGAKPGGAGAAAELPMSSPMPSMALRSALECSSAAPSSIASNPGPWQEGRL